MNVGVSKGQEDQEAWRCRCFQRRNGKSQFLKYLKLLNETTKYKKVNQQYMFKKQGLWEVVVVVGMRANVV